MSDRLPLLTRFDASGECTLASQMRSTTGPRTMTITAVEPIVLRVGEVDTGRADGTQDAFLVRVHTDQGIVGIGEADTSPYVARTIVEMPSSHAIARGLAELLVGQNPLEIDRLWQLMFSRERSLRPRGAALHTISAIDMALWDIAGKASGRPVCELLGGARVPELPVYASEVMPETAGEVPRSPDGRSTAATARSSSAGDRSGGISITTRSSCARHGRCSGRPVRSCSTGSRAYTVKRALELLRRLEDLGLYWLEEPLEPDDYEGYSRLSDAASVRIAAGEADSCRPFSEARRAWSRRRAPAGHRTLRRLHGRARDRPARPPSERRGRASLLLHGCARRRVAPLRGHARPADVLGVLGRGLAARQRAPRRALPPCGRQTRGSDRPWARGRSERGGCRENASELMAAIEFDHVTKRFPDGTVAVDDIELTVADGEFMIFVGLSGCGKTTALRMVAASRRSRPGRSVSEAGSSTTSSRRIAISPWSSRTSRSTRPSRSGTSVSAPDAAARVVGDERSRAPGRPAARHRDLPQAQAARALGRPGQRVAVGCTIIRHPQAFLMDEPISEPRAKLRVQMCGPTLVKLHHGRTSRRSTSHDQTEA